ncbi:hypothetical protein JJB11_05545 [Ramlibacter ginsenosidimutans]|uniref:DUF4124 domain-containing protein n=1 Tax=Ramlibacter ginsenosidimutans TaxID=502333 RepID=A0A934TQC3_9BURK|nr:hypothetical protein [Ramlibacter ginsenosidimutans]MBK6005549.1 hypothetical protein [Ramlibacter ginsenosidimutans]
MHVLGRRDPMKTRQRAWLLALVLAGVTGTVAAQGTEPYRCQMADGSISFQRNPCALSELVGDAPARPAVKPVPAAADAASADHPAAAPAPALAPPAVRSALAASPASERSVSTPALVSIPARFAAAAQMASPDEPFVKPTKRKREILDLTAQFQRCRADVPGFAEKSAVVYDAWIHRHGPTLAEYDRLLAAKVRAGRRGEMTLPLRLCTDDWLHAIEPLARTPDTRFQTVEKTWQVFLGALMTGDRATVLNCLSGPALLRWQARSQQLNDDEMRRIAASIRALKVQWGDDYEKEGLVADVENRAVGIAFRNINEEWKITELGGAPTVALPPN